MQRRDIPVEEQEAVLTQLKEARLIDDRLFARSWIRTRDLLAPRGDAVLRMELAQKGIAREDIDLVLSERKEAMAQEDEDQPTEEDLAREIIRRKERVMQSLAPEVRKRRQIALLQRRGFSYDVIRRILSV